MQLDPKLPTEAYSPDLKTKLASGTLLTVDNQIDPTTGTVKLKSTFPNQDESLFPNQFVNARLLVQTLKDAIIVPAAAVQRGPQGTFVYVVKNDSTVELRDVAVGPTEAEETAIENGLAAGEVVVTDGVDKLQKGTKVAVGKPGTTQPSGRGGRGGRGPTTQPRSSQSRPATTEETR